MLTIKSPRSKAFFIIIFYLVAASGCAQEISNKEDQINAAVLAAPEEMRAGATVLGFDASNQVVTLREGTNELICLADDPTAPGFNVACYHQDLEPFMARGRALKAEGKSGTEIFDLREKEVKAATLKMPEQPTTLHILAGSDAKYDPATGKAHGAAYRSVVYIPYATAASTGLPTKPVVPGAPWIMDPGTHRAHIMITPPVTEQKPQ